MFLYSSLRQEITEELKKHEDDVLSVDINANIVIIILDGAVENPGDLSWEPMAALGELTVYDYTAPQDVIARIGDAPMILTNKTVISAEVMAACPNLRYIGVLATGYNVIDIAEAKKRGIGIMMDLVINHTSDEHEWFRRALAGEEKSRNYYICAGNRFNRNRSDILLTYTLFSEICSIGLAGVAINIVRPYNLKPSLLKSKVNTADSGK